MHAGRIGKRGTSQADKTEVCQQARVFRVAKCAKWQLTADGTHWGAAGCRPMSLQRHTGVCVQCSALPWAYPAMHTQACVAANSTYSVAESATEGFGVVHACACCSSCRAKLVVQSSGTVVASDSCSAGFSDFSASSPCSSCRVLTHVVCHHHGVTMTRIHSKVPHTLAFSRPTPPPRHLHT